MSNSSMTSSICKENSQILLVHFPIRIKLFIYDFTMVTTVLYFFVVFNLLYLFSFSINNGSHDLYRCNKDALFHPEDDVIVIYANEYSKCTLFVCLFDGIYRRFQHYFSYIVAVSFIGGVNRRTINDT